EAVPGLSAAAGDRTNPRTGGIRGEEVVIASLDWSALWLSVKLSAVVTAILITLGLPVSYWLTFSRWRWKFLAEAVVALPIVLPPTVLGYYVLVAIGSRSPLGQLWASWT